MRGRSLLVAAFVVAGLALALPAGAVGYTASIEEPGSVARGDVVVRARVSGGVGSAEYAAYQVGSGGAWVTMQKVDDGVFEALSSPWATARLPNGGYRLEVRVWGDVPPYDPGDASTYAKQAITVGVDNAPPAPTGLQSSTGGSSVGLSWKAPATAGRSDFLGYRVLRKKAASCTGTSGYTAVAETSAPSFVTSAAPGTYCFRVVSLRSSPVSGVVTSPLSSPARVVIRAAGSGSGVVSGDPGFVTGRSGGAKPPAPPGLAGGKVKFSDGSYGERLPYGSRTITQEVDGDSAELGSTVREAGPDPRRMPTLMAAGLILAVGALLLRRFLAAAPER